MPNVIKIINKVGKEIALTLKHNDSKEYFKQIILLYSVAENFLKYIVATNDCWEESCKQLKIRDNGGVYEVDFESLRKRIKNRYTFEKTIKVAYDKKLITEKLREQLDKLRLERNNFIHQLWILGHRNDHKYLKKTLAANTKVIKKLVKVFKWLIYEEIGVDTKAVLQIL